MKKLLSKKILLFIVSVGLIGPVCSFMQAQGPAFDPLLDPACKIVGQLETEEWGSSYMWYPGQLSAHMQKKQKEKSAERCVYVGYPGKFNPEVYRSFFQKKVKLGKETSIRWQGPESIVCSVDGKLLDKDLRECTLKPGTHLLFFTVSSPGRLPCLIVEGNEVAELDGWEVSLDNETWNKPETYKMYTKPSVLPDTEQEITTRIKPDKYIFLRNASQKNTALALGKNGRVVVDFRHLEVGTVKLMATGKSNLSFAVGESIEEVLNENPKGFEQKPVAFSKIPEGFQEVILPERALRYLKIECDQPCTVTSICFEAKMWPVEFQMQFECNDADLNNLWKAGVATLHTSLHNFYLDGVKRDYLPWSMDAIVSSLAGDYLFGDEQISRNGLSIALTPPHPVTSDLGIVDYPLHALVGFKHNYMRYGDINTSLLFKDRIIQMLALYDSIQDERGFISDKYSTSGFIPGWATKMGPAGQGIPSYGQIMLYQNFVIGSYFARLWKEKGLAKKYEKKAEILRQNILKYFWDEDRKAFINGYSKNGEKDNRISHHAQYWAILAGLFPEKYYSYLFDRVLPEIPYYKEDVSYEKGYEFLAYVKVGRIKDMFSFLDCVWGDWLRQGNTRFPENFSPQAPLKQQLVFYNRPFGLSLCHGGNGVPPVVAVLHGLFGFFQSDKNISEYRLKPQLMELQWAKGRIPLKEGYININISKTGKSYVEIPDNCIVFLHLQENQKPVILKKGGKYEFIYL